jgi:hypothetical protein
MSEAVGQRVGGAGAAGGEEQGEGDEKNQCGGC